MRRGLYLSLPDIYFRRGGFDQYYSFTSTHTKLGFSYFCSDKVICLPFCEAAASLLVDNVRFGADGIALFTAEWGATALISGFDS